MLNEIKRQLKLRKEYNESIEYISENRNRPFIVDNELSVKYGVNIVISTEAVRSRKLILSFITENKTIWVDEYFIEGSNNLKDFVINHELGHHIKSHPLIGSLGYYARMNSKPIIEEIEADEHAIEIIGIDNVLAALDEILEIELSNNREIKKRKKSILNK